MFFTVVMLENVLLSDMSLKECKIIRPRLEAYAFLSRRDLYHAATSVT